jgi:Ca-activated chloride channel homolog
MLPASIEKIKTNFSMKKSNQIIFKVAIIMLIAMILVAFRLSERTISGTVSDNTGLPLSGVSVSLKGTTKGTTTDSKGKYSIVLPNQVKNTLIFSFIGMTNKEIEVNESQTQLDVVLESDGRVLSEVVVSDYDSKAKKEYGLPMPSQPQFQGRTAGVVITNHAKPTRSYDSRTRHNDEESKEEYSEFAENTFQNALKNPQTTFSIDVDRASYSNIRRMIEMGNMPPRDAVRIEEMINYFDYDYPQPTSGSVPHNQPVSINTEVSASPWNKDLRLLRIGIQGEKIPTENLPASNLVFLIDVSGSMADYNKLPLLKQGFKLLTDQLRQQDRVAIVVYAGSSGLVLPSTSGKEKSKIKDALDALQSGGSTAGGAGIELAYKTALENFIEGGNNRVILATDGDFNVGVSSEKELEKLIENKRKSGIFLSVLGFGMGNYKDNKMEVLADKGNGNYAYIDNIQEAQKTFIHEFGGTLFTIAKDVKLQLEFNPKYVKSYRLIGYENRMLKNEDFNNDQKDAGEMGSGHSVTALYEIIPVGVNSTYLTDKLKYQNEQSLSPAANSNELLTIKLRYKKPNENQSKLIEKAVIDTHKAFEQTSEDFRFASAVAEFGLLLRGSDFKGNANYNHIIETAKAAKGKDDEGYRAEFIKLVKSTQLIDNQTVAKKD